MTEIQAVTETPAVDVLAGAWPLERHLSPLALFDPNRTAICAQFQVALVDVDSNEARAHLTAARRHLQAAVNADCIGSGSTRHAAELVRALCGRIDTVLSGWD
ncbi:hypothetical protein [Streptomyces griseoflavus]|uniref:hypothetical protein n=1 Tax=Streptomyces griseoflavus TaxID=35619 RepID=UPI00340ADC42